ncbi:hypothetical protein Tcan_14200 [Toxocara canis]|uniref:Uncharacterized protein n=1 Tax=Toxocara canis TaxID=6265 RepID=A0A0B2VUW4_TOXCA|nr:hypothetical protein Tcan_14200 [Toxocara canis]
MTRHMAATDPAGGDHLHNRSSSGVSMSRQPSGRNINGVSASFRSSSSNSSSNSNSNTAVGGVYECCEWASGRPISIGTHTTAAAAETVKRTPPGDVVDVTCSSSCHTLTPNRTHTPAIAATSLAVPGLNQTSAATTPIATTTDHTADGNRANGEHLKRETKVLRIRAAQFDLRLGSRTYFPVGEWSDSQNSVGKNELRYVLAQPYNPLDEGLPPRRAYSSVVAPSVPDLYSQFRVPSHPMFTSSQHDSSALIDNYPSANYHNPTHSAACSDQQQRQPFQCVNYGEMCGASADQLRFYNGD